MIAIEVGDESKLKLFFNRVSRQCRRVRLVADVLVRIFDFQKDLKTLKWITVEQTEDNCTD